MDTNLTDVLPTLDRNWTYAPYQRRQLWVPYLLVYGIYIPIACTLGTAGNILSFIVIYPKIKERFVFIQQTFVILADLVCSVFGLTFYMGMMLGFRQIEGFHSIRKIGPLMWYFVRVPHGISVSLIASCQLLGLGTSFDRMFALYMPMRYKISNHRARSIAIIVMSFVLGFMVCSNQYVRYVLIWDSENGVYFMVENEELKNSTYFKLCGMAYLVLTFITTVAGWILIPMIIVKYRKFKNDPIQQDSQNKQKTVNENLLSVLLLSEGLVQLIFSSSAIVYYGIYFFPLMCLSSIPFLEILVTFSIS